MSSQNSIPFLFDSNAYLGYNKHVDIDIREVTIKDITSTHVRVPEFFGVPPEKLLGEGRFKNSNTLVLAACVDETIVGYIVAYDCFKDKSLYCWLTGVLPDYRSEGVFDRMMSYMFKWALKNGYSMIKFKSRNARREINSFLVKRGLSFTSIEPPNGTKDHQVNLEHAVKEDFDFEAKV